MLVAVTAFLGHLSDENAHPYERF